MLASRERFVCAQEGGRHFAPPTGKTGTYELRRLENVLTTVVIATRKCDLQSVRFDSLHERERRNRWWWCYEEERKRERGRKHDSRAIRLGL